MQSAAALSHVLWTTTLSYGNMRFSGTCQTETSQPINFCTIDYIGKFTRCIKSGWNRLTGVAPHIGEIEHWKLLILYLTLPFFLHTTIAQTAKPVCTHGGSDGAVCCEEVPFGSRIDTKLHFGVKNPQNLKFWNWDAKFPAKSIHLNNFWTVRNIRNISTDHLLKIGVGELNGDVISAIGRNLVTETTSAYRKVKNFSVTLIANRCQAIDWLPQIYS
jgi:hypothetical protein